MRRIYFISMTITATAVDLRDADVFKFEKTEDEKTEEKANYNKFMNFMTDIIVKYGLNENTK